MPPVLCWLPDLTSCGDIESNPGPPKRSRPPPSPFLLPLEPFCADGLHMPTNLSHVGPIQIVTSASSTSVLVDLATRTPETNVFEENSPAMLLSDRNPGGDPADDEPMESEDDTSAPHADRPGSPAHEQFRLTSLPCLICPTKPVYSSFHSWRLHLESHCRDHLAGNGPPFTRTFLAQPSCGCALLVASLTPSLDAVGVVKLGRHPRGRFRFLQ